MAGKSCSSSSTSSSSSSSSSSSIKTYQLKPGDVSLPPEFSFKWWNGWESVVRVHNDVDETVETATEPRCHTNITVTINLLQHYQTLFHHRTRTAYLYNGCLAWYNVVLTSRVHSNVKYSQQSMLRTRATVEQVCWTTACFGRSSLTLTYPTPDSGLTYACGLMDNVLASRVKDCRFKSHQGRMWLTASEVIPFWLDIHTKNTRFLTVLGI